MFNINFPFPVGISEPKCAIFGQKCVKSDENSIFWILFFKRKRVKPWGKLCGVWKKEGNPGHIIQ